MAALPSCDNQSAIVLSIRPPAGVTLSQYAVQIQDRESRNIIYQSGVQPIDAVAQGRDLSSNPLKVGLKLSKAGSYLVHVRAAAAPDKLAADGVTPATRSSEYFFAALISANGTIESDAELLEVQPQFDQDFDHFPDYTTWLPAQGAAQARYSGHPELLDCVDRDPSASEPPLSVPYAAAQINPLARPVCGLALDLACEGKAPVCADKDADGDPENTDCDDNDPKRFSKNPRPRNCCQCTDRASCATNHAKLADQSVCQPARCDNTFDYDCTGRVVSCFVDEDCDGFSPNDPIPALRDCEDTNANVYPGAPKNCADSSHDWACDGSPTAGCVPCDLDGDGFQRNDPANACPSAGYSKSLDCDDNDRGVFPGSTSFDGVTLITRDLKAREGGGSVAAALRGLCRNQAATFMTALQPQDADCDGNARNGCPTPACDVDGDGFPNAPGACNPNNLALDCDDLDPHTFPGAPERCGDGKAQGCVVDRACAGMTDADGDGYTADYDCNDNNANIKPWAIELCDGVDNDCDGLVDEQNPDNTGAPLTKVYTGGVIGIRDCTDDTQGECGRQSAVGAYTGRCVCGTVPPNSTLDPVPANRVTCPGTTATGISPKCYGATQPKKQTCDADNPRDDDCNGSTSDVTGSNLFELGMACGINQGTCRPGTVTGCNRAVQNAFAGLPNVPSKDRFLVCGGAGVVTPTTEDCLSQDKDCDLQVNESCVLGGATTPACCSGGCFDLNNNTAHCGNCTNVCSATATNQCATGMCRCGASPACSGGTPLCLGTAPAGTCVQCLADTNCTGTPTTPACNASNSCVECTATNTSRCTVASGKPICDTTNNVCVGCTADANCTGTPATPACATTTSRQCVECTAANTSRCTVASGKPVCDTATNTCVRCVVNSDCPAGEQCKTSTHMCVDCVDNGGCSAPTGQCDTTTNVCYGCVKNADCASTPTTPVCDTIMTHACVGCISNMDCSGATSKCNVGTHTCVQCLMTADCPGTQQCLNNACVQCTMDAHCMAPTPRCDNTNYSCVQCLMNGDCPMATPICSMKSCVECTMNANCTMATRSRCASNACALCAGAADCTHIAGRPQCKAGTGCVECLASADCSMAATPICGAADACVACTTNAQCETKNGNTPRCDTVNGDCEVCGTSASCNIDPNRPICDTMNGDCEQCMTNAQCDAKNVNAPRCDTVNGDCEVCGTDASCNFDTNRPICDTMNGDCQACMTNTQCDAKNPAFPRCDTVSGDCEVCGTNASCNFDPNRPVCDITNGDCEKCMTNTQCDAKNPAFPRCDTVNGDCEVCGTNASCNYDLNRPICDTANGDCEKCMTNTQCETKNVNTPKCDVVDGDCEPCGNNASCNIDPNRPICDTVNGDCEMCATNMQCDARSVLAPKCDTVNGDCEKCTNSMLDCNFDAMRPVCEMVSGACVQCTLNAHCTMDPAKPTCSGNVCVACMGDGDCTGNPNGNKCDTGTGKCVECLANTDCTMAAKSQCNAMNQCVVCGADGDCSHITGMSQCIATGCVACDTASTECTYSATQPICDSNNCRMCGANSECEMRNTNTPKCDTVNGDCEVCGTSASCDVDPLRPICDTTNGDCQACMTNMECESKNPNTPKCDMTNGDCEVCGTSASCNIDPVRPICDTTNGDCQACMTNMECESKNANTPKCDTVNGDCEVCGTSASCTVDPVRPICDTMNGDCQACLSNGECALKDGNAPLCLGTGACDKCTVDSDCNFDPAQPICDTVVGNCHACTMMQCVGHPKGNICDTGGACSCAASTDCTVATSPICDLTGMPATCRGCDFAGGTGDAECVGLGFTVCNANGSCS